MKITGVNPWLVNVPSPDTPPDRPQRRYVFVEVTTDEGISGWGEITTYPGVVANRAVASYVREVGELLIGDDPALIEAAWNKVFRELTYVGTRGATSAAVSGIDIALWDILGKVLGVPIHALLGGAVRENILLYTHPPQADTPEEAARFALDIKESGHTALKTDPYSREMRRVSTGYLDGQISREGEHFAVETIAAIREAVGPEFEILIDAHGNFDVPTAIRISTSLAPYNITWFEEPVPPESYHALRQVKDQVPVRICVGERLHTRYEFVRIFEQGLADFVMPDVTWTGGISELKKISTMAETYNIPMSPHDASGPINVLAGAHVMMTVPNFYRLETSRFDLSNYNVLIDEPLDVREGRLHLPERPGLGVEMDMDYLRANAVEGFAGA